MSTSVSVRVQLSVCSVERSRVTKSRLTLSVIFFFEFVCIAYIDYANFALLFMERFLNDSSYLLCDMILLQSRYAAFFSHTIGL